MKTPIAHDNVPGHDAIAYRVGRYGDFRETMLARLADPEAPFAPLNALRTRAVDDPTIALIDAFAAVGDVLTFYQERLANEGYLRTALEPRSVTELARLTGYRTKPGVASSVFLSFTVDPGSSLVLSAGTRAQSVPGPGQTAQSFETSDDLAVDGAWNVLKPRLSRPTQAQADLSRLFLAGVATGLKANDPLLLVADGKPVLRRVATVTVQADRKRTIVSLQPAPPSPSPSPASGAAGAVSDLKTAEPSSTSAPPAPDEAPTIVDRTKQLASLAQARPAANPPDPTALQRSSGALLAASSDAAVSLAAGSSPADRTAVFKALALTPLAAAPSLEAHAFRAATAPGGSRAPPRTMDTAGRLLTTPREWDLSTPIFGPPGDFSVQITTVRGGQASSPGSLIREFAAFALGRERVRFDSVINYGADTLPLSVEAGATDPVSGHLSDAIGDVACKLRQFDNTGLVLEYTFQDQPVTLLVSAGPNGAATAVNEVDSAALSNLAVTEEQGELPLVKVDGLLAIRTGSNPTEQSNVLYLDGVFETITPGTWVAFDAPPDAGDPPSPPMKIKDGGASTVSRSAYGQTARATRLSLDGDWIDPNTATFERAIRETAVYAGSVALDVAEEDVTEDLSQTVGAATVELDTFAPGLASGRWLMVTGERTDLPGSTSSELVMLAGSQHLGETPAETPGEGTSFLPGETVHTVLTFAQPLAFTYKLDTVSILGNVAKATQGESADEVLGSGNGATANQAFTLKKPPLTYVSAVTPSGAASTLRVYVNGLRWSEVDSLGEQGPDARIFVTQAGAGGVVTVRFGDGIHGARLPTGADNVRARYRAGIGSSGNVDANAVSTLLSRPLGLKAVTNPRPATGGANEDGADATRRSAPLGLVSLSRLVGVRDYEDFALTFAGIGKASARRFAGADGPLVHLTVAGAADDALDPRSDLWLALSAALDDFGDDEHEVELAARTAKLALISACVAIDPARLWRDVEPVIRARLLDRFSFIRRGLGQPIHVSEVVAAIQGVTGVAYVDLKLLSAVAPPADEAELKAALSNGGVHDVAAHLARVAGGEGARRLLPAELAYLSDSLPDMLVLNEIPT